MQVALPVLAGMLVAAAACGGAITGPEIISGGNGGSGNSGGGGGGGMGGRSVPPASIDRCVVSTPQSGPMHNCQTLGCHGGMPLSAGLDLSNDNLLNGQGSYLDVPNRGDPTGTPPACAP